MQTPELRPVSDSRREPHENFERHTGLFHELLRNASMGMPKALFVLPPGALGNPELRGGIALAEPLGVTERLEAGVTVVNPVRHVLG